MTYTAKPVHTTPTGDTVTGPLHPTTRATQDADLQRGESLHSMPFSPKLHSFAHQSRCAAAYDYTLCPADGEYEHSERLWALRQASAKGTESPDFIHTTGKAVKMLLVVPAPMAVSKILSSGHRTAIADSDYHTRRKYCAQAAEHSEDYRARKVKEERAERRHMEAEKRRARNLGSADLCTSHHQKSTPKCVPGPQKSRKSRHKLPSAASSSSQQIPGRSSFQSICRSISEDGNDEDSDEDSEDFQDADAVPHNLIEKPVFPSRIAPRTTVAESAPIASFVDRASGDGRGIVREAIHMEPPSPLKRARLGDSPIGRTNTEDFGAHKGSDQLDDRYTMVDRDDEATPIPKQPRLLNPKRLLPVDKAMNRWLRLLRDIFLAQLLRRDGCANASSTLCPGCGDAARTPRYRCAECAGEWNGIFFAKTSLKKVGLHIQFGHPPREVCHKPQPGHTDFVVLHDNGIHTVAVDCCGCNSAQRAEPYIQLLRAGWYPATDERTQTAATFEVLDCFQLHTVQAKTTAYSFYGASVTPQAQGAGTIILATGFGPLDWENAPPEDQFLYIMFLALDACFHLKRHMISSEIKDPGLGTGWAYVTETAPYRHYLLTVTDQKEANTKFSTGYSTTGVGMGVCARHEFVQPTGVGDLQKGKFANMDYIFGSILRHIDPRLSKIISYDIVCQWWKYLKDRMTNLPPLVRLSMVLKMFRFVIPKMHIHAHMLACQVEFSLNLVPGSGQTDGEGIERPWASIGAIASSTGVSGPGARHDALDDHWNYWNWLKTIGWPAILQRCLNTAKKEAASQREAFEVFSLEQAERVLKWKKIVEDFERDGKLKSPSEVKIMGLTEMDVRLQFAKEEEEEAQKGVPALHEVTPSGFVTAGLELEEQQCVELKKAGTTAQQINMKVLCSKLNRGIGRLRKLQATYTPGAVQALAKRVDKPTRFSVAPANELAEDVPLMLPSSLAAAEREGGGCAGGVLEIEDSLRAAQCRTSLPQLRNQLHIKSRFLLYKKHNARHQGMNTRSRTIVARNESKIRLHSERFQMAWQVRLRIASGDKLKVGWPQLKKEDIQCMQDAEEVSRNVERRQKATARRLDREAEMREDGLLPPMEEEDDGMVVLGGGNMREVSWIWTMAGTAGTDEAIEDTLRIEWSKAWARSRRWKEEVRLLEEEWRQLPVSYAHREQLWVDRTVAVPKSKLTVEVAAGLIAYATKQAQLVRGLAERAEITRTEAKLAKGKKRAVWEPTWDPVISMGDESEGANGGDNDEDENEDGEDDEDDERGDIDSDEELLMGREVDD
ncbi:hypothetical protein K438DRAFT_1960048 [Mycena galopus ATCC 62051]|nr:hypothetical protein K438DRAFT_1960048 [Mycena galopus ATCC 62051]